MDDLIKSMRLSRTLAQAVHQSVAAGDRLAAIAFVCATEGVAASLHLTDNDREQLDRYHAPADNIDDPDVTFRHTKDSTFLQNDRVRRRQPDSRLQTAGSWHDTVYTVDYRVLTKPA